jgi:predicted nucleotide-binding protein (sugar kinase/HSP70/actin superfamily)
LRTFIDVKVNLQGQLGEEPVQHKSKIPLQPGSKRLIVGNSCEKGLVEDVEAMRVIKKGLDAVKGSNPNLVEVAAKAAFKSFNPANVADPLPRLAITRKQKGRVELMKKREQVRIGMPRALNMYSQTPVFSAYFEALGIKPENLVYSDYTSEQLYKEGAKRGAIDPCFPSKVGIPHVHNLLYVHHKKKPLEVIFFPMIDSLTTDLYGTQDSRACPTVTTTPEAVKAAFIKEGDLFEQMGVKYFPTFVKLSEPQLFARQMYEQFKDILGLSEEENARAVEEGYRALDYFNNVILRGTAREVLNQLTAEQRLGIVLLARPYHHDPGINHEILEEFQKQGYPVFAQDALPIDPDILDQLFGDEVRAGIIRDPMDISDAWKNSYSENTSRKIWAAKYVARHPNLVALELSSFKCGHDAPIYTVVEEIVENSGTPYFCFKDIDENKPTGSIKIRVETISYFLKRYREDMVAKKTRQVTIEERMQAYERKLRDELYQQYAAAGIGPELVGIGACGHAEPGDRLLQLTEV